MFVNRPDLYLAPATARGFALTPYNDMLEFLRHDYAAMAGMIFGRTSLTRDVLASIAELVKRLNPGLRRFSQSVDDA
jgi:hypothetical protein